MIRDKKSQAFACMITVFSGLYAWPGLTVYSGVTYTVRLLEYLRQFPMFAIFTLTTALCFTTANL